MEYVDSFMLWTLFDERNVPRFQNIFTRRAGSDISGPLPKFVTQKQPSCVFKLFYYILIPSAIFSFLTVSVWMCISLRARRKKVQNIRRIKESKRNGKFPHTFPVFLLFCDRGEWVTNYFIQGLSDNLREIFEGDEHLLCTEDEHFHPGRPTIRETERLFPLSAVLLVIVSSDLLADPDCRWQLDIAVTMRKPVLLLLMEDVEEEMLPSSWKNFEILEIEVETVDGAPVQLLAPAFTDIFDIILELIAQTLPTL